MWVRWTRRALSGRGVFQGHDLAEVSRRCVTETRRFSVIAALHLICAISRALGFLHEFEGLGLVHRKLHPARVRLGYQGGVKLLDLASGRAVGSDGVLGSAFIAEELRYPAPEQLGDNPVDLRADVYALGVVLWETLAGCPFLSNIEGGQAELLGAGREQMIERIRAHRPPSPSLFNPEVRPELDAVVMRAVAKAPDQRFPTAGEFERALLPMAGDAGLRRCPGPPAQSPVQCQPGARPAGRLVGHGRWAVVGNGSRGIRHGAQPAGIVRGRRAQGAGAGPFAGARHGQPRT